MEPAENDDGPIELVLAGDLSDVASGFHDKLLEVPHGGSCVIYFDCPGGNPYSAISLMNLIRLRSLQATGVVTGECSSAAIWPFAACTKRFVTEHSVLLFHPMRWQSEENVVLQEATEWARHFGQLEKRMDQLLARLFDVPLESLASWMNPGRYVLGPELADAGLATLIDQQSWDALS